MEIKKKILFPKEFPNRTWVDQFYEEINQVMQRFNYYLIATSFLFLAFVTIIAANTEELDLMAIAIASFGILLSLYYFEINYHQTRVAETVRKECIANPKAIDVRPIRWTFEAIWDAVSYIPRAFKFAKERPVSHTWIVPFAFSLLWIFGLCWLIWCK